MNIEHREEGVLAQSKKPFCAKVAAGTVVIRNGLGQGAGPMHEDADQSRIGKANPCSIVMVWEPNMFFYEFHWN